jgi:hypothetical protein
VLAAIESNRNLADFKGVVLFATAKALKSQFMSRSLQAVRSKLEQQYTYAIDAQFLARKQAFVDLGRQVTAQGSYLSGIPIPIGDEP